ncbi:NTP transferase domain-containing protein [Natronoarchaeum rubrum]|uniref:NTP transferase domain-containing protein n=1 Tax=Natronoarchaeum rubrum TaxID=755311 RepID=UPI002112253E|nr:NTP transferase domain-containing protein [Natronoarchaeum rubrum]
MCGGEGRRLAASVDRETPEDRIEKPLFEVGGRPMIDRVLAALDAGAVDAVHAAVSPAAPETREHLDGRVDLIETPGEGYVADLGSALDEIGAPVLTVAADLPLLGADLVDAALAAHDGGALTVCVPAELKRRLGVGVDAAFDPAELDADVAGASSPRPAEFAPTGLNVATDDETTCTDTMFLSYDARLAVNVNRKRDAEIAEALL